MIEGHAGIVVDRNRQEHLRTLHHRKSENSHDDYQVAG